MNALAHDIARKAYTLDSGGLDATLRGLNLPEWAALVAGLEFQSWDTGGGCMMLVADLPRECRLGITDGETGLPSSAENFCVGITDSDGEEVYAAFVTGGQVRVARSPLL